MRSAVVLLLFALAVAVALSSSEVDEGQERSDDDDPQNDPANYNELPEEWCQAEEDGTCDEAGQYSRFQKNGHPVDCTCTKECEIACVG